MSPKSAQRFWDNDLLKTKTETHRFDGDAFQPEGVNRIVDRCKIGRDEARAASSLSSALPGMAREPETKNPPCGGSLAQISTMPELIA
ncbi:hypothetical protein [Mesorhizobium sangaii]|uniref:Uncharacterized protein n=1 Tax=Mesorhizobium sangaii TaxID=505389 RepID=A0A841P6R3_9HYPH|nr:hypothetical protein [Mesorhizobium sangaii]MBB6410856.1 hypothetical protein [Mesorhizobium sangaii]